MKAAVLVPTPTIGGVPGTSSTYTPGDKYCGILYSSLIDGFTFKFYLRRQTDVVLVQDRTRNYNRLVQYRKTACNGAKGVIPGLQRGEAETPVLIGEHYPTHFENGNFGVSDGRLRISAFLTIPPISNTSASIGSGTPGGIFASI
jgi:hypothetical protein